MVDIADISTNLIQDNSGIWVARNQSNVSYPSDGNKNCLAIEESSFWFNHRNDVITALVKVYSPKQTLFDIGGGNGYVAVRLQQAGISTVLVEPGPQGALNALQRGVKAVVQSTLEDAGFKSGTMAACGLFDVLEHIERDVDFLRAIQSYLRPEGRLYVTVPALTHLWSVDDDYAGHFRRYTSGELKQRLVATGFVVDYCSYFFWVLVPAVFCFRTIPGLLGIRRSVPLANIQQEHSQPKGFASVLLTKSLALELKRITQKKGIPIGTSCIAVATKSA